MSFLPAFTSTLNIWASRYINTGDRTLDQSLIVLFTILTSIAIQYISTYFVLYYNACVYILWNVKKDPLNINHVPFIHPDNDTIIKTYAAINTQMRYTFKKGEDATKVDWKARTITLQPVYATMWSIYYILPGETIAKTQKANSIERRYSIYSIQINHDIVYNHILEKLDVKIVCKKSTTPIIYSSSLKANSNEFMEIGTVNPKKTFNTLFYDQKKQLVDLLTKFSTGTMYPSTISMDNKMGILLYGPPGTGKTGTISAIANYLGRDIVIVNCMVLTTVDSFDGVLSRVKSMTPQPIIVFDEFDCILNVLVGNKHEAEKQSENTTQQKWSELLAVAEGDERKEILNMIREAKQPNRDTPLDLGYILSKLDGLEDNSNRLIIATTNNPDKINPSLLRPGRFDIKLCLSNCSTTMLEDIVSAFFECSEQERKCIRYAGIPEFKHSPLHVINTALSCGNLESTLLALK